MHFSFSPLSLCTTTGYVTAAQSLRRTTMLKLYRENKCGKNSTASQKRLQEKTEKIQKCSQPCSEKVVGDSTSRSSYALDQPCKVSCPSLCQTGKRMTFYFFHYTRVTKTQACLLRDHYISRRDLPELHLSC